MSDVSEHDDETRRRVTLLVDDPREYGRQLARESFDLWLLGQGTGQ